MEIRPEDVGHVAELARLELRQDEREQLAAELTAVLEYAATLRRLDLAGCAPVEPVTGGSALREDETVRPVLTPGQALAMAPESEGGFFVVPVVVENVEP